MRDQALTKHVIKLHAPVFNGSGMGSNQYTERVLISDNLFVGNADWTVCLGPSSNSADERARDLIVERNIFFATTNVQVSLLVWARDVTVRNNIFNTTGGKAHTCIAVSPRGIEPAPTDVRVLNNTGYSADGGGFTFISIAAAVTNTTLRNNLASAPAASAPLMNNGTGVVFLADHNLLTNAPGFVTAAPNMPLEFQLRSNSPAVNAGVNAPVFDDYAGNTRPVGAYDLGAYEFIPEPAALLLLVMLSVGIRYAAQP
jgi:hypothetical protein